MGALLVFSWGFVGGAVAAPTSPSDEAEELRREYERLLEEGRYEEATPLAQRACMLLEKAQGRRSTKLATCLDQLGQLYYFRGRHEEAETHYERALRIRRRVLGPAHPDVADSLNNLAELHLTRGEHEEAEALHDQALRIRMDVLGPTHPDVAQSLNNLAHLYLERGEYERAQASLTEVLTIAEEALGPDHPNVATVLNNLGKSYEARGRHDEAEPFLARALAIREKTLGPSHPMVALGLESLGGSYLEQGRLDEAKSLYERSLTIREEALGPEHPSVASSLNALGRLHKLQGEYGRAEPLYDRALAIREKALGAKHPLVAESLNNLAGLYYVQGEYGEAAILLERVLAIAEEALGPEHPYVEITVNNLAVVYHATGKYERAELLLERAQGILEESLGPEHPSVAGNLLNLAGLHKAQGQYDRAEVLLKRALSLYEKALGPNHQHVSIALNDLAGVYQARGDHEEAEPLLERALLIREKALGPDHPDVARVLNNLANLHVALRRPDRAVEVREQAMDIEHDILNRTLLLAEDRRRLAYAATLAHRLDAALSAHLQAAPNHEASARLALTTLLRRKGIVLELGSRSAAIIRRSLPEDHLYLLDDLSATRDLHAKLVSQGLGSLSPDEYAMRLEEVRSEQRRLWREIGKYSPVAEKVTQPITIASIQRGLPSGAILIEYARYRGSGGRAAPRYAAYLVFSDRFDWVDLGPAAEIEEDVAAFRRSIMLRTPMTSSLYERVIAPVLARMNGASTLFIAPDGELNLVPFAALYDGEGYLVEQYSVNMLATGRDLLHTWDVATAGGRDVVVVANPVGADLWGTELEAKVLGELFPAVQLLDREAATEAKLQRHVQPWLMHLATHGFFEVRDPLSDVDTMMAEHQWSESRQSLSFAPRRADNAMMLSGLVLSPGETGGGQDDGRLTAYEISGWDLRGTELVVLSACGSGLGEVRSGEGVLGLRRAFAMAGAETVVMSLWDVADSTTAKLMGAYYRELLAGKGRGDAMRTVQLAMLDDSSRRHPKDWASFVVVGDWTPLSVEGLPRSEQPLPLPSRRGCHASVAGGARASLWLLLLVPMVMRRRRRSDLRANATRCGSRLGMSHTSKARHLGMPYGAQIDRPRHDGPGQAPTCRTRPYRRHPRTCRDCSFSGKRRRLLP